MEVTVYSSEKYERNQARYIIFSIFFTALLVLLVVTENYVGSVLIFFLLGGYLFFSLAQNKLIKLLIADEALYIGTKPFPWTKFSGFSLEIDGKSGQMRNIILLYGDQKFIHTFHDDRDRVKEFIVHLSDTLPMSDNFKETSMEKLVRRLQL